MSTPTITATQGDRSITIVDENPNSSRFGTFTKWMLIALGGEGQ